MLPPGNHYLAFLADGGRFDLGDMGMNLTELRKALSDSDDLVEACRKDQVIILTKEEGERIIVVKHDALAAALEILETIDPGALMMAADELPLVAVPRSAHLRRIASLVAVTK